MESPIVGIDLGTTNSAVAWIGDDGRPRLLSVGHERIIPSVVAHSGGQLIVGHAARNVLPLDPAQAVRSVKRHMGSDKRFDLGDKEYTAVDISAMILRKMKAIAESDLGRSVDRAVITVPAYFSDDQRTATRAAGEKAGLIVERIINEPTAAALVYSLGRDVTEKVVVYDLGGGTFDVSVAQIESGVVEILATTGNNCLGGDDFDNRIVDYVVDHVRRKDGIDLKSDSRAAARLAQAAEGVKIALSSVPFARFDEPFLAAKQGVDYHLDFEISRQRFEELISDLVLETIDLVEAALDDAGLVPHDIDRVLLVGGSTRVPLVRERLSDMFDVEPSGSIHPDECVALGAAVQAALIAGAPVDSVLIDVTAHSLGIATAQIDRYDISADHYSVIIPRNTAIPTSRAEVYTTLFESQDKVAIEVYQGEEPIASHNAHLGTFRLAGMRARGSRKPEIVVTFDYDVDGIVHVRAEERISGVSKSISISRERRSNAKASADGPTLEDLPSLEELDVDLGTGALLERAAAVAANCPPELAQELKEAVTELWEALSSSPRNQERIDALEDRLLDLVAAVDDDEA